MTSSSIKACHTLLIQLWAHWVNGQQQTLTDVLLVVDDGVEGHVLVLQVPLWWFYVVGSLVGFDEALKAPVDQEAVGQRALFTWNTEYGQSSKNRNQLYLVLPGERHYIWWVTGHKYFWFSWNNLSSGYRLSFPRIKSHCDAEEHVRNTFQMPHIPLWLAVRTSSPVKVSMVHV